MKVFRASQGLADPSQVVHTLAAVRVIRVPAHLKADLQADLQEACLAAVIARAQVNQANLCASLRQKRPKRKVNRPSLHLRRRLRSP